MRLDDLVDPQFLQDMVEGYLECALWTSNDWEGEHLDDEYDLEDLDADTRLRMQADCAVFLAEVRETLLHVDLQAEQVGHDFWLSRNRHGAGFWDRGLGLFGDNLTKAAQVHGSYTLYLADEEAGEEYGKILGSDI